MTARTLQVAFPPDAPSCAWVRGFGARELLTDVTHRAPLFGSRVRAWCAQPHTARNAIALAESRGWHVEIVSEAHLLRLAGVEVADERGRLW